MRYDAQREWKTYAASDGSLVEQEITHVGAVIEANAVNGDDMQRRSYPDSAGRRAATSGFATWTWPATASGWPSEAMALLAAPQCPPMRTTVILHPSQLYMQVHESCGHPDELDRVFGTEASYAGTSFLTPDRLGTFRYGSDLIDIVADATAPGGLGTFGWDDEGVAAQRVPLIEDGRHVGYLTSRETAPRIGRQSGGRDAGRRLEPHPADPHDQHQPAAAARHELRRHRRRHRRRPAPGHQPVVVASTTGA